MQSDKDIIMSELKNSNVLISGAKGFIGSNLIKTLAANNNIVGVDNLLHAPNKYEYPGVEYIDTCISQALNELQKKSFDYFFHLGEYSRVEQSVDQPMLTFDNSTRTILQVIEFCESKNIKLIYSGSSTKFAEYKENNESPYAKFKKLNTDIITTYAEKSNLRHAICYFYNVYGESESDDPQFGTVIQKYIRLSRDNEQKLPVTSPGTQKRNFTHIEDTIDALIYIACKGSGDGYGICANESYSILDIVKLFGREPDFLPPKPGNRQNALNLSQKTKALGWRQNKQLERYIKEQLCEIQ